MCIRDRYNTLPAHSKARCICRLHPKARDAFRARQAARCQTRRFYRRRRSLKAVSYTHLWSGTYSCCVRFYNTRIAIFPQLCCRAMMYVVIEELIPEMSHGNHSNIGTVMFAVGFTLMMILDVALG